MKALILAAGRSTRLGELTTNRPKAMVKIAGKFLIDYVLEFLDHPSITEIGIVTGYKSRILTEYLAEYKRKPLQIFHNPHFHEGSVRTVMAAIDFLDTDFILLNADHIYPKKLLNKYLAKRSGLTIACDFDRSLGLDDMKIKMDKPGHLAQISKTLSDYDGGYIGSSFIPNAKLKSYKEALMASYDTYGKSANAEAIIGHMASTGHDISIADLSKIGWLEIDTQKDLKHAEGLLKKPSILKMLVRYVFAIIGISIFSSLVLKTGPSKILSHIVEVGWWLIPVFLLSFLWYCFYTFAWSRILKRLSGHISFGELFRIKIIGESLNTLTPLNFVAGDPARAYFLKHKYPFTEGAASVVVDRTLHSIATLTMILIGTAAAFVELKFLPKNIKYGLPIVLAIAIAFVGFIFIHQRKGLFTFIAGIARRLRIKKTFSTNTLEKFEEVDGHIQDFYKKNRKGFWAALLSHLFGRALGIFEIFIVGHAVNSDFGLQTALLLCAAAPIINFMFTFIPGSLGIMESAYSGILYFLHFSPSIGLTIQIIRRVRAGLWTILGFILLGTHGRKKLLQAAESKEV